MDEGRPNPLDLLRRLATEGRRRALLRVYLGYAPGGGVTSAMLDEASRRAERGTDVVLGAYSVHGEPSHELKGLPVVGAPTKLPPELDLDINAVLARNPEVVCIDDLVGLDTAGRPRFESVPRLLAAGITVLATLHVLSLQSAAAAMAEIAGERPEGPLLDDAFVNLIDELEIVDVTPEDLIRRIREQAILTPAELAQAMQRELRLPVLRMLRETGLRLIAEHADRQLSAYLPATATPLEFRRKIVLCLPPRPGLEGRIRAAGRYAALMDAKFLVVTVRTRGLSDAEKSVAGSYAAIAHQMNGQFVRLDGRHVARTLAGFITQSQATEVIIGHRHGGRRLPWNTTSELIRLLRGVDVHILRARSSAPTPAAV